MLQLGTAGPRVGTHLGEQLSNERQCAGIVLRVQQQVRQARLDALAQEGALLRACPLNLLSAHLQLSTQGAGLSDSNSTREAHPWLHTCLMCYWSWLRGYVPLGKHLLCTFLHQRFTQLGHANTRTRGGGPCSGALFIEWFP